MKQITLNNFKSLISGLSADSMIDMMPPTIRCSVENRGFGYTYEDEIEYKLMYNNGRTFCIEYFYEASPFRFQYLHNEISIESKHACSKMLLRLLENNYLPDYQLITYGKDTTAP